MKILQINATYGIGSTGNIVRDIKHCCEQFGLSCFVAYQNTSEPQIGYKIGCKLDSMLHSLLCRIEGKESYFSTLPTRKLLEYISELKPDIVHLHNLHNHYININQLLEFLSRNKIKTVITLHDCWFFTGGCFHYTNAKCNRWQQNCGLCPLRYQATPAYIRDGSAKVLADRKKYFAGFDTLTIVGASKWVAEEAKKSFLADKNICFIHNGFNLEVFKPSTSRLRERLNLMDKQVILGPTAKWLDNVNRQTFEFFVEKMDAHQVLVLFGPGNFDDTLPENVIVYGYTKSKEELAWLYSMADVFVNCSREDTLSSINLEAQACGTPVVTYEATGSKETVIDTTGFAVETGNYEMLWAKTNEVLCKGKQSYAENCRAFIEREYELNTNYMKYLQLYKKMVSNE